MVCARTCIHEFMDDNGWTSGLVRTSTSLSLFCLSVFLCARILRAPTGHSFLDIAMKLCRHIALGGEYSLEKKIGGQTPLGEIFPQNFFSRYRSANFFSNARDPGNIWLILFYDRSHTACAGGPDVRCYARHAVTATC